RAGKTDGGVLHAGLIEIGAEDHLETGALEGGGDILRIMRRIWQMWHARVGAHRGSRAEQQSHNDKEQSAVAHTPPDKAVTQPLSHVRADLEREKDHIGGWRRR